MERKNLSKCGPVTIYRNIGGALALVATIKPGTARAEARAIADRAERMIRAKARRDARKAKQTERVQRDFCDYLRLSAMIAQAQRVRVPS